MKKRLSKIIISAFIVLLMLGGLGLWFSPLKSKLEVHADIWLTQWRVLFQPVDIAPTPQAVVLKTQSVIRSTATPTQKPTEKDWPTKPPTSLQLTASPTATALPPRILLPPPMLEAQDWNNCGPDTLAAYLRIYGWEGAQNDISNQVKPQRADRNVNIDELATYVSQNAGWLRSVIRVGGTTELIKELLAAGFPVMIEESFYFDAPFWYQDDLWGGHYLLLTGYDETEQTFMTQDSDRGADRPIDFQTLEKNWQAFNRVYFVLYPPDHEDLLSGLLGEDWNEEQNRQRTLDGNSIESQKDPENPFVWFNLGTNLVYFKRYQEAAEAYDKARTLNMPQRMLRYQFGPFLAYFQSGRLDDLDALVEYAIKVTPNSEEAFLWKGWTLYRQGKKNEALSAFNKALENRPGYPDALYAIQYINEN